MLSASTHSQNEVINERVYLTDGYPVQCDCSVSNGIKCNTITCPNFRRGITCCPSCGDACFNRPKRKTNRRHVGPFTTAVRIQPGIFLREIEEAFNGAGDNYRIIYHPDSFILEYTSSRLRAAQILSDERTFRISRGTRRGNAVTYMDARRL